MRIFPGVCLLCFALGTDAASAQVPKVEPRIATQADPEGKVAVMEVAPRFVTAIGTTLSNASYDREVRQMNMILVKTRFVEIRATRPAEIQKQWDMSLYDTLRP
jgi:hypothetical protein